MNTIMLRSKMPRPHLGRAVWNGKIRYTSVSQIKLFDVNSDGGCPRKWAYGYIFGKKLSRTKAQTGGSDYAEKLEHYLTTGEDVLPRVLEKAKKFFPVPGPDLECEHPLGDMEKAVALRDAMLKQPPGNWPQLLSAEIEKFAGLTAAGIPVDGAADVRHTRGEYTDQDGILRKDPVGAFVVHIDDLKCVSRIFPQKIQKGPNAGNIIPSYCKTDAEVCEDTQTVGYARHAINKYPGMTHARLSLIYANTTKREAVKRTGIISVEQVLSRWAKVEDVVRQMELIAPVQRIEDVEPNTKACDSYTHVDPTDDQEDPKKPPLKGCGHRYYCPLYTSQVVPHMLGTYKESTMSLMDQIPGAPVVPAFVPPTAPVAPPLADAAHAAAVALERAKLMAELGVTAAAPAVPVAPVAPAAPAVPVATPAAPPQFSAAVTMEAVNAVVNQFRSIKLSNYTHGATPDLDKVLDWQDGGAKFRSPTEIERAGYSMWSMLGSPTDLAPLPVVRPPTPAPAAPVVAPPPPVVVAPPPPAPAVSVAAPAAHGGPCRRCGVLLTVENISRLESGDIFHVGCLAVAAVAPAPSLPIAVASPDQPRTTNMLDLAVPPPRSEIEQVTDPVLREQLEQHAREHAARAAVQAAAEEAAKVASGTSVWCPGGSQKIIITSVMAVNGYTCTCGKHYTVKALKAVQEGDVMVATIARHKPKKAEETAAAAPDAYAAGIMNRTAPAGTGELATLTSAMVAPVAAPIAPQPPAPPIVAAPVAPTTPAVTPPPPPVIQIVPAAPQHTNGHTAAPRMPKVRTSSKVFRVHLKGGESLSVIATTMSEALVLGGTRATELNDQVKGLDELEGEIVEAA